MFSIIKKKKLISKDDFSRLFNADELWIKSRFFDNYIPNAKYEGGRHALWLFIAYGVGIDLINKLIQEGADVNCKEKSGQQLSALHMAVFFDRADVLIKLIENNADLNVQDKLGNTPLMKWKTNSKDLKIPQVLLEHGANPAIKNQFGVDAFKLAEISGRKEYIQLLKRYKK